MSWSEFYETMEQPAYKQSRSESMQASDSNVDFDAEWANAKTANAWDQQAEFGLFSLFTCYFLFLKNERRHFVIEYFLFIGPFVGRK